MVAIFSNQRSGSHSVNDSLVNWDDIKNDFHGGGILLGNGFSQAVWHKFGYSSLYETASSTIQHPLTKVDKRLFESRKTQNFERVLSDLAKARDINKDLKQDYKKIVERYEYIKNALGEAIRAVHVPWDNVDEYILRSIALELRNYKFVYSTNYDLLTYWAIMSLEKCKREKFKDFFWGGSFNIADSDIYNDSATRVFYLHGALHLSHDLATNKTYKIQRETLRNLLDIIEIPSIITEGSSEDKLQSIRGSNYLSFAYEQFLKHKGTLVIFGHSLGETDQHLLDAIKKHSPNRIAISIRSTNTSDEIIKRQADLNHSICNGKCGERPKLIFFDALTHPLGSADVRVD